jgi:hypothetical protein
MDCYSGFIRIQNISFLKQATIGNFRALFGQGLTLGGNSLGSYIGFGNSYVFSTGIRPTQSVAGYGYFRGGAFTIRTGPLEWSLFLSYAKKDATLDSIPGGGNTISSFSESGYHRTWQEASKKNRVAETVAGGHVSLRGSHYIAGVTGYWGTWNFPLLPGENSYNQYTLRGDRFGAFGADGRIRILFFQLFGEYCISLNGGMAWLAGITLFPSQTCEIHAFYRDYGKDFQNPLAVAPSQNTEPVNEKGLYCRITCEIFPRLVISGYADIFRFPWMKYRVAAPSTGAEAGIMATFQTAGAGSLSGSYICRTNQVSEQPADGKNIILTEKRSHEIKLVYQWFPGQGADLVTQFRCKLSKQGSLPDAHGYLFSQGLRITPGRIPMDIRAVFSLFDCPEYDARIYLNEPDLRYSWSSLLCYGKGIRFVMMLGKSVAGKVTLSVWAGITKFTDRDMIGSEAEEITGSVKADIKAQLMVKL